MGQGLFEGHSFGESAIFALVSGGLNEALNGLESGAADRPREGPSKAAIPCPLAAGKTKVAAGSGAGQGERAPGEVAPRATSSPPWPRLGPSRFPPMSGHQPPNPHACEGHLRAK